MTTEPGVKFNPAILKLLPARIVPGMVLMIGASGLGVGDEVGLAV